MICWKFYCVQAARQPCFQRYKDLLLHAGQQLKPEISEKVYEVMNALYKNQKHQKSSAGSAGGSSDGEEGTAAGQKGASEQQFDLQLTPNGLRVAQNILFEARAMQEAADFNSPLPWSQGSTVDGKLNFDDSQATSCSQNPVSSQQAGGAFPGYCCFPRSDFTFWIMALQPQPQTFLRSICRFGP